MMQPEALILYTVMALSTYAYAAICLFRIARNVGVGRPWFAWIPVLQVYIACKIVGKGVLWTVLAFIPLANIYVALRLACRYSTRFGKRRLFAVLFFIPFVFYVACWMIVEASGTGAEPAAARAEGGA